MNLVNELQASAESEDVLTVLRKTRRFASKLGRRDISEWLKSEQDGYASDQDVPDYRMINARLAIKTNGYVPAGYGYLKDGFVDLSSSGVNPELPHRHSISSVLSEIESLASGHLLFLPIQENTYESRLIRSIVRLDPRYARQINFVLCLNEMQLKAIPERIKDRVLDWACALEAADVHGKGLSFSAKEKETSQAVTFNIYGSTIEQLNNSGINLRGGM